MTDLSLARAVLERAGNRVEMEYRFHPTRRWRFDLALPDDKIAVEVEGIGGRHQRTAGFIRDMDKYNQATVLGWRLLRVTTRQVASGELLVLLADMGVRVEKETA